VLQALAFQPETTAAVVTVIETDPENHSRSTQATWNCCQALHMLSVHTGIGASAILIKTACKWTHNLPCHARHWTQQLQEQSQNTSMGINHLPAETNPCRDTVRNTQCSQGANCTLRHGAAMAACSSTCHRAVLQKLKCGTGQVNASVESNDTACRKNGS
jgi:hypothetical protein